jgi:AraC family transcriptional regulator of adaptative response / DNA-3-methyladenine glycosylase II
MIAATILKYKPPADWKALLRFLAPRAIRGVEAVDVNGLTIRRSLRIGEDVGWVETRFNEAAAHLEIQHTLGGRTNEIESKAIRVFDLDAPGEAIERVVGGGGTVRVPGAWDEFEMGVRAILGQQITVRAAHTLAGRLAERWGERLESPWADVGFVFPSAGRLAGLETAAIRSIGLTENRAGTLSRFAEWSAMSPERRPAIRSLKGIGPWTEAYFAMRAGKDRDAFPAQDLGVQKGLALEGCGSVKAAREATRRAEAWRPYRAYGVMLLWASLASNTKEERR